MNGNGPINVIVGVIALTIYGLVLLAKLILANIWLSVGILSISMNLFFLALLLRKKNWNLRKIRDWLIKNNKPIFYLIVSGTILFLYREDFWNVLFIVSIVWGILLIVDQIIHKVYGCRVCNAKGKLSGHNQYLDVDFENNKCYACNGTHLVFKDKSDWYNIILKTRKEIKKLKRKLGDITKQLRQFSSEVKIGKNVKMENVIQEYDLIKNKHLMSSKDLETSIQHHKEIEKNAHIFLHIFHLKRQHRKWKRKAEHLDEDLLEVHETALTMGHEAELALKYGSEIEAFEELMESGSSYDVADELRLDIEKATENLKLLFKESR